MSRIFGEMRQVAFVVSDIDRAMSYWSNVLGVGPFFVRRKLVFVDYRYRGEDAPSPTISVALANSGAMQVELIEQHDEAASIYREFLLAGREGLQHVSAWVDCAEFDRLKAELATRGLVIAQEGTLASTGTRVVYYATEQVEGGLIYEVSDLLDPKHYPRVERIARAAQGWDGTDAVREVAS